MRNIFIIAFISTLGFAQLNAQVSVQVPEGLDAFIANRTAQKKSSRAETPGFQVLIFSGDSRAKAEQVKKQFESDNPGVFCEIEWDEPNFKVYAGAYTFRLDCVQLSENIKGKFSLSLVVSKAVPFPPLEEE